MNKKSADVKKSMKNYIACNDLTLFMLDGIFHPCVTECCAGMDHRLLWNTVFNMEWFRYHDNSEYIMRGSRKVHQVGGGLMCPA